MLVVLAGMSAACSRLAPCLRTVSDRGVVVLADAGAEPRSRLVYAPAQSFHSYVFRVIKRTPEYGPEEPAAKYATTIELTAREDYCFDVALEKQEYYHDSRRSYGAFTRLANDRSMAIIRGFLPTDKMDYALARVLETQLEEFPIVFPDESVGRGARWTYSRPYSKSGFQFEQRFDYTLESREGDHLTLAMAFVSAVSSQRYQGPSAAAIEPLRSFWEEGRGRVELNLGDPLPSGNLQVDLTKTTVRLGNEGPPETTRGSMEITFELR